MAKYYRCDYMDSGINFERKGAFVCCKTAHEGGGMPVLAETYADFDWDKIFELKKQWKKQSGSKEDYRTKPKNHVTEFPKNWRKTR